MIFRRILVVEDDEDIKYLCKTFLEAEGYPVETCSNGREALASLDRSPDPCLILLDMLMPIMGGREFMAEFLKRPTMIAPIPIYLVSATAENRDGIEMGCLGFLKKPFGVEALLAVVRSHCKPKREVYPKETRRSYAL